MKKPYVLFTTLLLLTSFDGVSQTKDVKLGLLYELTFIKNNSELILSTHIDNKGKIPQSELQKYMAVKTAVDQFINQLEVDIVSRNSRKKFKRIDIELKTKSINDLNTSDELIGNYNQLLKNIAILFSNLSPKEAFAEIDIIAALELGINTITNLRDHRLKKVELIIAQLEKGRLSAPKDILAKEDS